MKRMSILVAVAGLCGCLTPSRDIAPAPGDFAFIEVQLKG